MVEGASPIRTAVRSWVPRLRQTLEKLFEKPRFSVSRSHCLHHVSFQQKRPVMTFRFGQIARQCISFQPKRPVM